MRGLLALLLLVLLVQPLPAGASPDAVKDSFLNYQAALLTGDGEKAANAVTQGSRDYYRAYADQALTLDRQGLKQLHVADRVTVMLLRHSLDRQQLESMTGGEIIAYAVEQGWIDKESTARIRLGDYAVQGDFASAALLGKDGAASPFKLEFLMEDGQWRLDLAEMLKIARFGIDYAVRQSGMSEEEFVFFVLEYSSGRKPGPEIWSPPA